MRKYVVISSCDPEEFDQEISERLNDGWELSGDLVINRRDLIDDEERWSQFWRFQPMTKNFEIKGAVE